MQHERVQILLKPGQRVALALRAKQHVIETIRAHRQEMLARRAGKLLDLNPSDVLNEIREERGDELSRD